MAYIIEFLYVRVFEFLISNLQSKFENSKWWIK